MFSSCGTSYLADTSDSYDVGQGLSIEGTIVDAVGFENRVCSYQLPLLGQEASVDFWFHTEDGDKLWRIVVHWETDGQENAHRLQAHIKACLADEPQPFGLTEDTAGQEVRFSLRRFSKDRIYSITVEDTSIQLICKIG